MLKVRSFFNATFRRLFPHIGVSVEEGFRRFSEEVTEAEKAGGYWSSSFLPARTSSVCAVNNFSDTIEKVFGKTKLSHFVGFADNFEGNATLHSPCVFLLEGFSSADWDIIETVNAVNAVNAVNVSNNNWCSFLGESSVGGVTFLNVNVPESFWDEIPSSYLPILLETESLVLVLDRWGVVEQIHMYTTDGSCESLLLVKG